MKSGTKEGYNMKQKEKTLASKLYNTFSAESATDNESKVAQTKLVDLLKKHNANLKDFCEVDKIYSNMFDLSGTKTSKAERLYLLTDRSKKKSNNEISRRKLVINMLKENKFTKREIAVILTNTHKIADLKNNLKCVSGTVYDLQTHNKATFKIDNESNKIVSVFA
jgi:hypothetical protein